MHASHLLIDNLISLMVSLHCSLSNFTLPLKAIKSQHSDNSGRLFVNRDDLKNDMYLT